MVEKVMLDSLARAQLELPYVDLSQNTAKFVSLSPQL